MVALAVFSGCGSMSGKSERLADLSVAPDRYVQEEFVPVSSKIFQEARYTDDRTLSIKFDRGQVIHYRNVPEEVASRFINIAGRRGYYKKHIRDDFLSDREEPILQTKKLVGVKMSLWDKPKMIYEGSSY